MTLLLIIDTATLTRGFSIAVAGLVIVFAVLILISLFIAALPHLLAVVARVLPEVEHGSMVSSSGAPSELDDDDAVFAAIGFVLHTEFQKMSTDGHSG